MRLFLRRLTFFSVTTLLALILWEFSLRSLPNSYDVKQKLLEENQSETKILFLGTSHVFSGIKPEMIECKALNLANSSQSLYYDINLVKNHLDGLPSLRAVVFEINFFSFYYNLDKGPEDWRNIFYYQSFGIKAQTERLNWLDLSRSYQLKRNEIKLLFESQEQNKSYFSALGFGGGGELGKGPSQESANLKFESFTQEYINDSSVYMIERFGKMLSELEGRDVDIYLLHVPASSYLTDHIKGSKYLKSTNDLLELLKQKHRVIELNYLDDPRFSDDLFHDADHLNLKGAKRLTSIVNEDMKTIRDR